MGPFEAGVRDSIKEMCCIERVLGDVPFEVTSETAYHVIEAMKILLKSAINAQRALAKEYRAKRK